MFGGPAVAQKHKVGLPENVPFLKEKFKNFLSRGASGECFLTPAVALDGSDGYY